MTARAFSGAVVWVFVAAAAMMAACLGKTSDGDDAGASAVEAGGGYESSTVGSPLDRSSCSTGEPFPFDAKFRFEPGEVPLKPVICIPRCEYSLNGRVALDRHFYYVDAVPSGACSVPGERCFMGVQRTCGCASTGARNSMRCDCIGANWSCAETGELGLNGCECEEQEDASADGGSD